MQAHSTIHASLPSSRGDGGAQHEQLHIHVLLQPVVCPCKSPPKIIRLTTKTFADIIKVKEVKQCRSSAAQRNDLKLLLYLAWVSAIDAWTGSFWAFRPGFFGHGGVRGGPRAWGTLRGPPGSPPHPSLADPLGLLTCVRRAREIPKR